MAEREVELVEGAEGFAIALNSQELGHLEDMLFNNDEAYLNILDRNNGGEINGNAPTEGNTTEGKTCQEEGIPETSARVLVDKNTISEDMNNTSNKEGLKEGGVYVNRAKSGKWLRDGTLELLCECVRDHKVKHKGYKTTIKWEQVYIDLKERLQDVDPVLAAEISISGIKSKYQHLQSTIVATSRLAGTDRRDTGSGRPRWEKMSFKERKLHDKGFKIQLSKDQYENLQHYFVNNVRDSQAFGPASTSLQKDVTDKEQVEEIDGEEEINSPESNRGEDSRAKVGSGQESTMFINSVRTKRRRSSPNLGETLTLMNEERIKRSKDEFSTIMDRFESVADVSTSKSMTLLGGIIEGAMLTLVKGLNPSSANSNNKHSTD